MSSTQSFSLIAAKTIGIFTAGWLSSVAGTNSIRLSPLYAPGGLDPAGPGSENVQLTTAQRLAVWHTQYNSGAATVVPIAIVSTTALAITGALSPSTSSSSFIPSVGDKLWFYTTAGLVFSIIPYTLLVMMPGIGKLKKLRLSRSLDESSASGKGGAEAVAADRGMQAWNNQHRVRAVVWSIAFVMTIVGSIH